jgi:hypothetical protein
MESQSGAGSSLVETEGIREGLPLLFKTLDVHTLLDAPCGDFNWMKTLQYELDSYVGVDIWKEIIEVNHVLYGNEKRKFMVGNIVSDVLPKADLILCRDCLVHLPFQDGVDAIENFKRSGSKYLAATSYFDVLGNDKDCERGGWRKVNLELPPYNLGKPLTSVVERGPRCLPGVDDYGKLLNVWLLQ